jgi:TonB-dependent SusC/RagA subfamily outer membrane receptor
MKLTFILLTAGFLQVTAASYAQQVTLKVRNVSIKAIFEKIQAQTQYDFLYKTTDLQLTGKLSLDLENVSLKQALDKCFEQQPLVYTIENTTILVSRRPVAAAADIVIRGKVTNDRNLPLPGVAVRIRDMRTGTVTDADGNFEIKVPNEAAILVFSFIGYEPKEVKIPDSRMINVSLVPKNTGLDEVVVVGYGTQKRTTLTGAVSSVKGEQLKVGPVANISNRLGGNVAGVITRQASGEPGNDAASVLVRGTAPLVLVDGVERAYDKINPEDVETISVLKDASAVAPYGLRGANGVMLITTKRGKAGKLALNYNIDYGFQQPTNTPDFMNAYDGLQLRNEALRTDGRDNEVIADDVLAQY